MGDDDILRAVVTAAKFFAIGLFAGGIYVAVAWGPIFTAETKVGLLIGLLWSIFVSFLAAVYAVASWLRWWRRAP